MVLTGILILSFYTIVIGWIFKYIILSFSTLPISVGAAGKLFGAMVSGKWVEQFIFFNIAFFLTMWIVARGVKRGIERVNFILMPLRYQKGKISLNLLFMWPLLILLLRWLRVLSSLLLFFILDSNLLKDRDLFLSLYRHCFIKWD